MFTTRFRLTLVLATALALGAGCGDPLVWGEGDGDGGSVSGTDATSGKTDGKSVTQKDGGGTAADQTVLSPDLKPPPGKKEICGNAVDDNGNGQVDEGCSCKPGATQQCYPWPVKKTQGICKLGSQQCTGTAEFAQWAQCMGAVLPQKEVCGNAVDEDCDGKAPACPPRCGDGTCNGGENCNTCPQDCGKCCGNGICEPVYNEDCKTCQPDCGACKPYCGDGKCNGNENCATCTQDCGQCPTKCETFTFGISARAVDIVIIVDQSGSMSQEISGVKQNLNAFSNYIAGTNIDYHVIMLARRGTSTYDICIPPPLGGANCGDGPRYKQVNVAVYSTDSLKKFQQNISAIEAFMRPKSYRQILEITDDNAYTPTGPDFHNWIKGRPGYNDYVFHSIVGLHTGGCVAREGTAYKYLSNQTSGMQEHICSANWNSVFQRLGQQVAGIAIKQYQLTKKPLNNAVTVSYNGVQKTAGVDYDYDATNNQVVLKGNLPPNNSQIKICYAYLP